MWDGTRQEATHGASTNNTAMGDGDQPAASGGRVKAQRSPTGAASVVTSTIRTTADKRLGERSGWPSSVRRVPMPAKIRPTSPRGTMPIATAHRLIPRPVTPRAQASLPTSAQPMSSPPSAKTGGLVKAPQLHLEAHQHEEERHKEAGQGVQQFRQGGVLLARPHARPVGVQQQTRRKGPDDGGQHPPNRR